MKRSPLSFLIRMSLCLLCLVAYGCSDNDEEMPQLPGADDNAYSLTVIFSTGGLGDMTYNDSLLSGALRFYMAHHDSLKTHFVVPASHAEAEAAFRQWVEQTREERIAPKGCRLLLLASSEYEQTLARAALDDLPEGNHILLLESGLKQWPRGVGAVDLHLYGGCYLAGRLIASRGLFRRATVVAAMPGDPKLDEGIEGFRRGLAADVPELPLNVRYLADDATGYLMEDSAFVLTQRLIDEERYQAVLPLCGGSALGIYRKLNGWSTPVPIGMDGDCSQFGYFIPFSVVRRMGTLVNDLLETWMETRSMPAFRAFGLESGYTRIVPSKTGGRNYDWERMANEWQAQAAELEKAYHETH